MRISVAIPTHEMKDADFFLRRSLDVLKRQSFKDFEVVITDNSDDSVIQNICSDYEDVIDIKYWRNPSKGMAQNTNAAIRVSQGELIKILYLDDFFAHENSIQEIVDTIGDYHWLVTGCVHAYKGGEHERPHYPRYSDDIHLGNNTIGSPSVLTIKNEDNIFFDENMTWLLDADYYRRLYDKWGNPRFLKTTNVVIGLGDHQVTHILSDERKVLEYIYMKHKYE